MLERIRSVGAALQHKLARFPGSHTWRERVLMLGLFLAAASLIFFARQLSVVFQIVAWAALLLLISVTLRRGWIRFFGPVFFHDVVRSARRSNFALLRGVYAGVLLAMLFMVYSSSVSYAKSGGYWDMLWSPASVNRKALATFGDHFFLVFSSVQMAAVLLLTPLCAAGAITEEKERRTLEFVLATDLSDREIILGKLASRMAYLVLFVLTGLPILSFLQFLGGLDPNLVMTNFAMTLMTMTSVAAVSVAVSVAMKRTRSAVFFTYLLLGGYLVASSCCFAVPLHWITGGNPVLATARMFGEGLGRANPALLLIEYCAIHGAITLLCYYSAAANLRSHAPEHAERPPVVEEPEPEPMPRRRQPVAVEVAGWGTWEPSPAIVARYHGTLYPQLEAPPPPKPPVSADPILWKELYAEPLVRFGPGGQSVGMILAIMGLLTAGYVLLLGLAAAASTGHISSFASILARFGGNALACMMLLGVALAAAGTLTTERDRQTLDGLLTTSLDNKTILQGKWLGSIFSVRKGWWFLGPIWVFAVLTGGIHPLALPLLLLAWVVYASFVAGLGSVFVAHLSIDAGVNFHHGLDDPGRESGGHRGLWFLFQEMWSPSRMPDEYEWIGTFLQYAFTPPLTIGVLTFRTIEFEQGQYVLLTWRMLAYGLVGIVCFAALAALLWGLLLKSFGPVTGRMPLPRSKRNHEPAAAPVRNG